MLIIKFTCQRRKKQRNSMRRTLGIYEKMPNDMEVIIVGPISREFLVSKRIVPFEEA